MLTPLSGGVETPVPTPLSKGVGTLRFAQELLFSKDFGPRSTKFLVALLILSPKCLKTDREKFTR